MSGCGAEGGAFVASPTDAGHGSSAMEMRFITFFCRCAAAQPAIIESMTHTRTANSRTLTVVLSEADWRALREVEPDAVGWLHARIQERLGSRATQKSGVRTAAPSPKSTWNDDLY
jgi:hypothetical protein